MTDGNGASEFGRMPAASVMAECLRVQAQTPARTRPARIFGISPLSDESRPWFVGALGEIEVARRLEALGSEWHVAHSVPVGDRGSDVDHIVVGPGGVFTVNTKFHEGATIWLGAQRLLVNGQKTDHLRNARYEGQRVARMLSAKADAQIPVRPLIVIVGAARWNIKQHPADVAVLRDTDLVRWLTQLPASVPPGLRERVTSLVLDEATWGTPAARFSMDDAVAFQSLRDEVLAARRTRRLWVAIAVVGFFSALALAVQLFGLVLR